MNIKDSNQQIIATAIDYLREKYAPQIVFVYGFRARWIKKTNENDKEAYILFDSSLKEPTDVKRLKLLAEYVINPGEF